MDRQTKTAIAQAIINGCPTVDGCKKFNTPPDCLECWQSTVDEVEKLVDHSGRVVTVVAAMIHNWQGEAMMVKHGECECGCQLQEMYEFPGGKVECGEDLEFALIREIREELGLEIAVGPLVHAQVNHYSHSANYYAVLFYKCYSQYHTVEKDHIWVTSETISLYDVLPGAVVALRKAAKF